MKKPKPTRKAKKKTLPPKAQPLRSLGREIILKRMTSTFLRVTEGQQIDDALEDSLITNYHLGIGRGDVKPKPLLKVNVPEWGGSVCIRVMTAEDRESWEIECRSNHKVESFRAKYLARCLCGENGERLFSDNEASMLGEKSAAVIGRLWEKAMQYNAPQEKITGNGYPLPPDLEAVIDHYVAKDKTANSQEKEERRNCFRQGFFLALLRYADELKENPEAAESLATLLLAANRENSKKGILAIKRKAALKKKEAKRLDRLLRNTVKKKYLRVERIAKEMNAKGMKTSERNVERNLSRKKKPIG